MGDLPRIRMVRAQRRTRKEVGLEKALPEMVAQRRTQKEMRAQRRTRNVIGLENVLPKS
jgi:hypothetical protein